MTSPLAERDRWLAAELAPEVRQEILAQTPAQAKAFFEGELAFGTGGLRGPLGPGPRGMNIHTVRRATQGLAEYLLASGLPPKAAIAYDSRLGSQAFAREVAAVLAANGIHAHLYPRLQPTPALSWAVRALGCGAGVCITASHNPATDNGYKVYGPDGCQLTLQAAQAIQGRVSTLDYFTGIHRRDFQEALASGDISYIPEALLDGYLEAMHGLSLAGRAESQLPLRVVYTPLHGAGRECVTRVLQAQNVEVHLVAEQAEPDGGFPTCPQPNPEDPEALALGLRDCALHHPDLLLATDPDCDRIGLAAADGAGYRLFTGNEVGMLLLDYLCLSRLEAGTLPQRPVVLTTIVSTPMADSLATKYGLELTKTLTGFKFIGEEMGRLEAAGQGDRFLFGFEESCGYLSGMHVRDKDAVNAALLLCDMARWHKARSQTLPQAMDALYREHGAYATALLHFTAEGEGGQVRMNAFMAQLRQSTPQSFSGFALLATTDYLLPGTGLPQADVLALSLEERCQVILRPSGTEPKLKAYLFAQAEDIPTAQGRIAALEADVRALWEG